MRHLTQTSVRRLRFVTARTTKSRALVGTTSGFTLVELLVVIGIIALLATMTLLAVDMTMSAEKVPAAGRQVQSMIEGARDRAIYAGAPRGVRFLVEDDPLNGRKCSSMIYIGGSDNWSRGRITLMRADFDFDGVVDPGPASIQMIVDAMEVAGTYNPAADTQSTGWVNLFQRGYLPVFEDGNLNGALDPGEDLNGNGVLDTDTARIKIPGDRNGTWYHVSTYFLSQNLYSSVPAIAAHPNVLALIPISPYRDSGTTPPSEVVAFEGTGPNTYILELPSRVLPDAEPVLLPGDVVIDLDASSVPASWRPSVASLTMPYSSKMDLLFSPRGTVIGDEAAAGLIQFYIGTRKDVTAITSGVTSTGQPFPLRPPMTAATWTPYGVIPGQAGAATDPVVGDRAVVTVITQTGRVGLYDVDVTDAYVGSPAAAMPGADKFADNPFYFTTR